MKAHRPELADVFRTHEKEFLARWRSVLSHPQLRALRAIRNCRTAALGGISSSAIGADIASSYITHAAIGIVPSVLHGRIAHGRR
jgi:hypothetical protein